MNNAGSHDMHTTTDLPAPPPRPIDGHKGTFGRVLIIAGSRGMSGAAVLAGTSALRGGAGLVSVATPEGIAPVVAAGEPAYMTVPLTEDRRGRIHGTALKNLTRLADEMTAVAIGPGLGHSAGLSELVCSLYRDVSRPMVVDADALNALSEFSEHLGEHAGPRIVTPHPGEFSRLTGMATAGIQADRELAASRLATQHDLVVVLKGSQTVVADRDRRFLNTTGNSGMATGGAGDVLTGLLAALLAQGMEPFDAARFGVWLHGRAGDLAAAMLSKRGLIASDLPRWLCEAWREVEESESQGE